MRFEPGERFKLVVKALVKELGSQAAAAEVLGISTPYVGRIVRDEIGIVRTATIDRVEEHLERKFGSRGATLSTVVWDGTVDPAQWALDFRLEPVLEKEKIRPFLGVVRHMNRQILREIVHGKPLDTAALRELARTLAGSQAVAIARRMVDMPDQELLSYAPSLLRALEVEFLLENDRVDAILRPRSDE